MAIFKIQKLRGSFRRQRAAQIPTAPACSTENWISGLSMIGNNSLSITLVTGRNRVPRSAAGKAALGMECLGVSIA